ncbi:MAG: aminopeptidase [Deltaproteobacteria bacterium]|nr:aminopeptidase [Deltaproteobacteria bacterium]
MKDPRVEELARILIHYSLEVEPHDVVLIRTSELGKPLALAAYERILEAGAHPLLGVYFEEAERLHLERGTEQQIDYLPAIRLLEARNIDSFLHIAAPTNRRLLSRVAPVKISRRRVAMRPVSEIIVQQKRWVLVDFPTQALAQEAEMSLEEYEDFLFRATNIDWKAMDRLQERLKKKLDPAVKIRIVGPDTDISFAIRGRQAVKCTGKRNMPDGEVYLSPLERSANGHVSFEFPAIYNDREVSGIRLVFRRGQVVEATAEKGEDFLLAMLDTDAGARFVGELGIGLNDSIQRFTRNILFDEKMGGTIHIALGQSYKKAGGKNRSAIHWDMIKDLRSGGRIFLDECCIFKDGRFID